MKLSAAEGRGLVRAAGDVTTEMDGLGTGFLRDEKLLEAAGVNVDIDVDANPPDVGSSEGRLYSAARALTLGISAKGFLSCERRSGSLRKGLEKEKEICPPTYNSLPREILLVEPGRCAGR